MWQRLAAKWNAFTPQINLKKIYTLGSRSQDMIFFPPDFFTPDFWLVKCISHKSGSFIIRILYLLLSILISTHVYQLPKYFWRHALPEFYWEGKKNQQVDHHIIICEENHVWSPGVTADMGWFQDERVDSGGGITVEHGPSRSFFGTPSSLQSLRQDFS